MLEEFRSQQTYKAFSVIGYIQIVLSLFLNLAYFIENNASNPAANLFIFLGTPVIISGYIIFAAQLILLSINFYKFITTDNAEETETKLDKINYLDIGFIISIISFLTILYLSMEKSGFTPLIIFVD